MIKSRFELQIINLDKTITLLSNSHDLAVIKEVIAVVKPKRWQIVHHTSTIIESNVF